MLLNNTLINKLDINHGKHVRISSVEGLRALAVILVFVVHYTTLIEPWINKTSFGIDLYLLLKKYGNYGVELFFIISGYLIYSIVIKSNFNAKNFILKRLQRIYPTFIFVLSIYIIICFLIPSESKLPAGIMNVSIYIIQNIFMLPGMFNIQPLITVSWTLSYEMFFYLLLPIIISTSRFRNLESKSRIYFIILPLILYWGFCYFYGLSISRISVFTLGCLAYEAKNFTSKFNITSVIGASFILLGILITYLNIIKALDYTIGYLINIITLFCFYICVTQNNNLLSKFFSFKYIRWFGNFSYSYFLFHGLCLKVLFHFLAYYYPPDSMSVLLYYFMAPLCFFITVILSLIVYLVIEYPFSIKDPFRDFNDFKIRSGIFIN